MKLNTANLLQVEDDEHDVFFLQHAFQKAGLIASVRAVTSGEQAVDYLAGIGPFANRVEYPLPSLVLLDLKLPRKSGLEVLQWLRERAEFRSIVIVVLTSSCDPADIERSYQLGANSFVVKPLDVNERVRFAQNLRDWWLGWNRFAPAGEINPLLMKPVAKRDALSDRGILSHAC